MTLLISSNTVARADPKPSGSIDAQGRDVLVGNRRFILVIEYDELDAVESGQTFLGANSKITVRRARYSLDGHLRQALRNLPGVE